MTLTRQRADLGRPELIDPSRLADNILQLLHQALPGPVLDRVGTLVPPADVEETSDSYVVDVELPGVKRDDVSVEVDRRRLIIRAERKERERTGFFRSKTRATGWFLYELTLPDDIDPERVTASLADGVLELKIDKSEREQSESRKVPVH